MNILDKIGHHWENCFWLVLCNIKWHITKIMSQIIFDLITERFIANMLNVNSRILGFLMFASINNE